MRQKLRNQRLWELLEQFPRAVLHHIARAAHTPVRSATRKHELLDMLSALPEEVLERALVEGLTWRDLEDLCARIGRARRGTKGDLAARILAAVDEPAMRPRWRPFAEARAFAHSLALKSRTEWFAFVRGHLPAKGALPEDIPKNPRGAYATSGWTNWGDFLGTGNLASHRRTFRPFRQARAYVRSLGLRNIDEWWAFCRVRTGSERLLPQDVPAAPHQVYAKHGWAGYTDWLGVVDRRDARRTPFRSYEDAHAFVRALGIRSSSEWLRYCRGELDGQDPRPLDIPATPDKVYRGRGWVSWGHFLGTNATTPTRHPLRAFAAARAYVRTLGLRNVAAWKAWSAAGHRPADIPAAPDQVYRAQGWVSWGDFLGTGNVHPARIRRRSFAAARALVRRLGLRSGAEYHRAWRAGRIPRDIPAFIEEHPAWQGWADFLGPSYTGRPGPKPKTPKRKRGRGD